MVLLRFALVGGAQGEQEVPPDATVECARQAAAHVCREAGLELHGRYPAVLFDGAELRDDAVLLSNVGIDSEAHLDVYVRGKHWEWLTESTGETDDQHLRMLLEHYDEGYLQSCAFGGFNYGVCRVLDAIFPETPQDVLNFLRGGDGSAMNLEALDLRNGTACWALDTMPPEQKWRGSPVDVGEAVKWRQARVVRALPKGDWITKHIVEWSDVQNASDGLERRMFDPRPTNGALERVAALTHAEWGGQFKSYQNHAGINATGVVQKWDEAPLAPPNMQAVYSIHFSSCEPRERTHLPVVPGADTEGLALRTQGEEHEAPWWDCLALRKVPFNYVEKLCKGTVDEAQGFDAGAAADADKRANDALNALMGISADAGREEFEACLAQCSFYTHCKVLPDGQGHYFHFERCSVPLVIVANPSKRTLAFAYGFQSSSCSENNATTM